MRIEISKEEVDKRLKHCEPHLIRDDPVFVYAAFAYILHYFEIYDLRVDAPNYCDGTKKHPLDLYTQKNINSLTAHAKQFPCVKGEPLPYYLLNKFDITFSGCAGEDYCQFSFLEQNIKNKYIYGFKPIDPERFLTDLYVYFHIIKEKYPKGVKNE